MPTVPTGPRAWSRRRATRRSVSTRAKARAIETFERAYLIQLMREAGGNVTSAAKRAGKERRALGKLLKKYAIDKDEFA